MQKSDYIRLSKRELFFTALFFFIVVTLVFPAWMTSEKFYSLKNYYNNFQRQEEKKGQIYLYFEGEELEGFGGYCNRGITVEKALQAFGRSFSLSRKERKRKIWHSCSIYLPNTGSNKKKSSI